jgi:hypothetical protein
LLARTIRSAIAVHAQESYLFALATGNGQNFGDTRFQYATPKASLNQEIGRKLQTN